MTEKRSNLIIQYSRGQLSDEELLNLYRRLLTPRLVEEKMLILLRQGQDQQVVFRDRAGAPSRWLRQCPAGGRAHLHHAPQPGRIHHPADANGAPLCPVAG